jgi:hypothetical protein
MTSRDGLQTAPRLAGALAGAGLLGIAGFVVGALVAPERAWAGLLVGFHFVLGISLAGAVFLALLFCSGAKWAAALRRVPEAMSAALPVPALAALVLLFGVPVLFEWSHASALRHDPVLAEKSVYLNAPFLAVRTVAAFALWLWLASRLRAAAPGAARVRWGAAFMAVFAVSFSWTSVDWIESLEPHWTSTIFALTSLAGLAQSGIAVAIVLAIHLRRNGAWRGVLSDDHLHDAAKLLFAFGLFWAYIQYSQYLLVWYTNIPEETSWFAPRLHGMWWTTGALAFALCGVIPFVLLLFRRVRRSEQALLRIAALVLAGRVADLFFQIGPPLFGPSPWPSAWEVLPVVGLSALFALVVLRRLARGATADATEPGLEHSLHYHA